MTWSQDLREIFEYFKLTSAFLRLDLPTPSCPTMISLVLKIDFEPPVKHALWKLFTASRPLALISYGVRSIIWAKS